MAAISGRMKFKLGDAVKLEVSGETGRVIGRWESDSAEPAYFVRFKAADGRGVEAWWTQSAVAAA